VSRRALLMIAVFSVLASNSFAAPVTGWTVVNPSTGAATTKPLTNQSTNSPILGNGTEDSAAVVALYASISGPTDGAPDVSLANGEQVTLSGFATMSGIVSSIEQFRWGLFQESSAPINAIDWTGYMASNSSNSGGGALRAKTAGDGTTFAQSGNGVTIATSQDGDEFIDETYHFSMTVSRFDNEVAVDASLTNADDWTQEWRNVIVAPPTAVTFNFNRVGFLAGSGMHANRISFSNIDVTTSPIETVALRVYADGPNAGLVEIVNNQLESFEIEYYEILSAGSLNHSDWTSLDQQEGTDQDLEGWEEAAGNNATVLSEYRLFSSQSIAPDSTLSLGKAFDVGSPQDLRFFVGLTDGAYLRGVVEYVSDGLAGDFNADSAVDAADYVTWRKGFGTSHIDDDLDLWRTNFARKVAGGRMVISSLPEPSTIISALAAFVMVGSSGRIWMQRLRHPS